MQTTSQPLQCELPTIPLQIGSHFLKGVSFNESAADNLKLKTVHTLHSALFTHFSILSSRNKLCVLNSLCSLFPLSPAAYLRIPPPLSLWWYQTISSDYTIFLSFVTRKCQIRCKFLPCLGRKTGNTTSLTLTNQQSCRLAWRRGGGSRNFKSWLQKERQETCHRSCHIRQGKYQKILTC